MVIAPTVPVRLPDLGSGSVEFTRVAGRTVVTSSRASSPLRFLTPGNHGRAAWLFVTSFGGGMVAGDHLHVDARVNAAASAFVGTQSSTKVYRCAEGLPCKQSLVATLAEDSLLAVIPDPVICFADARYEQRQRFELSPSANLALLDWLVSGRYARGERWAFSHYFSRNDVYIDGRHVLADPIRLSHAEDALTASHRLHACEAFGTILLVGPRFRAAAEQIQQEMKSRPLSRSAALHFSCSPLADGVLVRFAATEAALATGFVRETLAFLRDELGECPWTRKS